MEATTDWGHAIVVDPRHLEHLEAANARLRATRFWLAVGVCILVGASAATGIIANWQARRLSTTAHELREVRRNATRANQALSALARSHENILAATQKAPSVGTKDAVTS